MEKLLPEKGRRIHVSVLTALAEGVVSSTHIWVAWRTASMGFMICANPDGPFSTSSGRPGCPLLLALGCEALFEPVADLFHTLAARRSAMMQFDQFPGLGALANVQSNGEAIQACQPRK